MAYLLDSDVFIRAKNLHYGFDFCPAFWTWLELQSASRAVGSVEKVGIELKAGDDDLAEWAKQRESSFFARPDASVGKAFGEVSAWATSGRYRPGADSVFMQSGDYYLVAQALAGGHTVVTHEVPSDAVKRIKIPDACLALGVSCMTPYQMLRAERARFSLA